LVETALPINFPPSEDTASVGSDRRRSFISQPIFEGKKLLFGFKKDKEGQRP
jgi:hypothetical protein